MARRNDDHVGLVVHATGRGRALGWMRRSNPDNARLSKLRYALASLSARADERLVGFLLGQLNATASGVELTLSMASGRCAPEQAHEQMCRIEHEGDKERGNLVEALSGALGTSIDREDLFRLSRSIDDVLDGLRDFIREFALYGVLDSTSFGPLIESLVNAVAALRTAVADIAEAPSRLPEDVLAAKKAASALRRGYQYALSNLLGKPVNADTLKVIELMRRLDTVGTCLSDAADALADGALKRWH
ncbi:DUF47 domain-containing protein [Streptomyces sp. NPDC020800]|uniref:DUF47 domain-containing protein n=1 Tax=Streptomyces sp. NPDC020800 TaxID=3365092 RepID=UPI00379FA5D0